MKTIHNPNPIKLNKEEQEVVDKALVHIESLMFGDWKDSSQNIGTEVLFREPIEIDYFRGKKDRILIIKGKNIARYKDTDHFVVGGFSDSVKKDTIEVFVNGFFEKKSFSKAHKEDPFDYWYNMTDLRLTIIHEIVHAKDPQISEMRLSGGIRQKYGTFQYINDPTRAEFLSFLSEWDELSSAIQEVVQNKDKNLYYQEVYKTLKFHLCKATRKDGRLDVIKITDMMIKGEMPLPFFGYILNMLKEMMDASKRKYVGAMKYYEKFAKYYLWKRKYEKQKALWDLYTSTYKLDAIREVYQKQQGLSYRKYRNTEAQYRELSKENKDKAIRLGKEKFYAKYPDAPKKKPKLKTKLTKSDKERIFRVLRRNYTDMMNNIYSLFNKKGLLDICISEPTPQQQRIIELQKKREHVLLKREKIIINALLSRFENMNL